MAEQRRRPREEDAYNDSLVYLQPRFPRLRLWINGTRYRDERGVWHNGGLKQSEGMADLVGWVNGIWLEVEVKTATGRQKLRQEQHQALVEAHGGIYVLARTPAAAEAGIRAALAVRS